LSKTINLVWACPKIDQERLSKILNLILLEEGKWEDQKQDGKKACLRAMK
jgi:hypothetical protein